MDVKRCVRKLLENRQMSLGSHTGLYESQREKVFGRAFRLVDIERQRTSIFHICFGTKKAKEEHLR